MEHFYENVKSIKIDMSSLYQNHIEVIRRYDFGDEKLHEMMDRFIPQIVEELYEFEAELENAPNNNFKKFLELSSLELLDVILYLVSINSTLIDKFGYEYKENKKYVFNFNVDPENINYKKIQLDVLNNTIKVIGASRRICPNRKYHEDKKEATSKEDLNKAIEKIFNYNDVLIEHLFSILFGNYVIENPKKVLDKITDVVLNK